MERSKRRLSRKQKRRRSFFVLFLLISSFLIGTSFFLYEGFARQNGVNKVVEHHKKATPVIAEKEEPLIDETEITVSAAGDFTIGTDESFGYHGTFVAEADKNGLEHFVKYLDVFKEDDFTTVNLETTLTTSTQKAAKTFRFKGDPSYAKILKMAGIEAVNLANNHIYDYLEKGFRDTLQSLEKEKIGYFGYVHHFNSDHKYVTTVKNVKIGALGYEGWNDTNEIRTKIENDIKEFRDEGVQIIIVHFHWGVERQYVPTQSQQTLARFTIDCGADLVLGHHPHVVQGIEEYNGKFIVYSLGNFMFGGNRNPSDKDTFVFQQTFHLENGVVTDKKEINIIPFSISSVTERNNYQPKPLTGAEGERVKNKILEVSNQIKGSDWIVYDINQSY